MKAGMRVVLPTGRTVELLRYSQLAGKWICGHLTTKGTVYRSGTQKGARVSVSEAELLRCRGA